VVSTGDTSSERLVPLRLQKFLARSGVASRRGSEELMTAGRVAVNGVVVTQLGAKVDPATDVVTVDGEVVEFQTGPVTLMLHKPAGYVTTMDDPQGRPTVAELMPEGLPGLFPVGRLDRDTTGLLLLTTDGELGFRLLHPRFHVQKVYRATVDGVPSDDDLARLRAGIELDDGPTRPAGARLLERCGSTAVVELVISEGRKRQVKRMLSAVGHPVVALHREGFGPLELGSLPEGQTRELEPDEAAALYELAGGE
jgi:23S rRNA pseudouridine2605 synthase